MWRNFLKFPPWRMALIDGDMSRLNGTFRFRTPEEPRRDPNTGFLQGGEMGEWVDGGRCQIDKYIPAKQVIGTDGMSHTYTYDLFVPRPFHDADFRIGTEVEVTMEDCSTDSFIIQGVDNANRRYIELWG